MIAINNNNNQDFLTTDQSLNDLGPYLNFPTFQFAWARCRLLKSIFNTAATKDKLHSCRKVSKTVILSRNHEGSRILLSFSCC